MASPVRPEEQRGGATTSGAALEIVEQPPPKWYKDQFGRKATFGVQVHRTRTSCARCAEQRHLAVTLLYETGKLVDNQSVLHVAAGLCLDKDDRSSLAVRIMEVSKNHQNQRFRLQIALPPCPDACSPPGFVVTDPVLVLSKKNKRHVKTDDEGSPSKAKKSKFGDAVSPIETPLKMPVVHPSQVTTPRADTLGGSLSRRMADEFADDPMGSAEPSWSTQAVPFTTPNESVCLWANAAYNFLNKLQWQRCESASDNAPTADLNDILTHRHTKYQCVVCQAEYGSKPVHHEDCDLSLLLEQGGRSNGASDRCNQPDQGPLAAHTTNESTFAVPLTTPIKKPQTSGATGMPVLPSPHITPPSMTASKAYDIFKFSSLEHEDAGKLPLGTANLPAAFGAAEEALGSKTLDLNSWEGYSTLSKIMFSTTMDNAKLAEWDGGSRHTAKSPGTAPPVLPALADVATALPPDIAHRQPRTGGSLSFSNLMSTSTLKMLPAESVALFQEDDAALNGDANLLCSLSRVSLSELLDQQHQGGEHQTAAAKDTRIPSSLSVLLGTDADSGGRKDESCVCSIVAEDFTNCGYPAFDASRRLVGFYMVVESSPSVTELHFLPNLYPLPPPMLAELEQKTARSMRDPIVFFSRSEDTPAALEALKRGVLEHLARSARSSKVAAYH